MCSKDAPKRTPNIGISLKEDCSKLAVVSIPGGIVPFSSFLHVNESEIPQLSVKLALAPQMKWKQPKQSGPRSKSISLGSKLSLSTFHIQPWSVMAPDGAATHSGTWPCHRGGMWGVQSGQRGLAIAPTLALLRPGPISLWLQYSCRSFVSFGTTPEFYCSPALTIPTIGFCQPQPYS